MSDCDFNASIIDIWQRQTYEQTQARLNRNEDYKREMKKVRRTHICAKCHKYPGDKEYTFGDWNNNIYTCFDCI